MKKMLVVVILGMMVIIATQAQAGGWVVFGKVVAVHNATNQIHFKTDASDPNSPCINKNEWSLSKDNPEFEEMYKMILTAQVSGQPGRVAGTGNCVGSQPYKQDVSNFLLGLW